MTLQINVHINTEQHKSVQLKMWMMNKKSSLLWKEVNNFSHT